MIALPAFIMTLLQEVPMGAWGALADILRYIVKGDGTAAGNARIRAEALAAHALLHSYPVKPVAIATQPKAE